MSATSRGRCGPAAGGMRAILILLLVFVSGCRCQADQSDIRRREVVQGGNITLTCYAEPGHLRTYRWVYIRSDTRLPQVLSAGRRLVIGEQRFKLVTKVEDERVALQLQLSDVQLLDSGLFMCWRKGVRPDPQILLTVLEPGTSSEQQVITQLSGPTEVQYGESPVFTCNIKPAWPVKVTWLKNGAEIPATARVFTQKVQRVAAEDGDGEILQATLFVDSIRDSETFTCRIETEPPEERSVHVAVRVARVQSLTAEPDKDTVEYGQPLKLTCVVSGTKSEVVWLKDGAEMAFGPSVLGREKVSTERPGDTIASTIYIDAVSFSDNGHYVCYVPGASKNMLINIEGRPPRLLGVTGGNFFEDEPLTLRCSTQYVKHNQRSPVTWNFEGLPLDPHVYGARVEQNEYNVTVHELLIPVGRSHHTGTYECVTPFGSASIYVDLFVPPSLGEPLPSEVEVEEGRPLEVPCSAVGRPVPSVQWEKLVEDTWVPASELEGVDARPDGLLRIQSARLEHAGDFRCAARSEAGSFLAGMLLRVDRIPAEVVEMMSPEDVMEGDNFTVLCTVANFIGPVDFWFNGAPIDTALQPRYSMETYLRDDGLMNVYLTVQEATLEDSGFYECHAGPESSLTTDVMVQKRPWEVLDLKASHAILGQDFFLSCTVKDWPRKVTFYHNGNAISERDDARYTVHAPDAREEEGAPLTHVMKVAAARSEDEGVYQCSLDGYSSASVAVVVEEPREEVLGIAASAAVLGRDFNITCQVKNWDNDVTFVHNNVVVEPEREWRYEVSKLPGERPEISSHVLTVTSASLDDSGYYECYTSPMAFDAVAVEVWREADVTLELQTLDRPNWMDAPIPLNCKVEGVDPNKVTIMFLQEDTPRVAIQNKTKMSTSNDLVYITITEKPDSPEVPETTFTLGFYSLSHNHSGFWSCEVLHPSGASLGKALLFLEVADIPQFAVKPPEEVFEDLGEDLYLHCSTSGPSDASVAWFRKGIPEPIVSHPQSASLFIPGFTSTDEGEYYCQASLHDREIRAETVLRLRTAQPKVESVTTTPGVEGEDLTITCTVSRWNEQVLFFINGEAADPETSSRYSVQRQPGPSEESVVHTLTVHDARLEDAGVAECFISLEEFDSALVEVAEAGSAPPTRPPTDDLGFEEPTLPPGRIIDLVGPALVEAGSTLTLTCLVSPVMQEEVVLTHDVFLLTVGDLRITTDPRVDVVSGTSGDGTRLVFLNIAQVRPEDGGEYRCDTSTEPPASATWIVSVVPAGALAAPATTAVPPTTPTSTEEYDYEDLPPGINATLGKEKEEEEEKKEEEDYEIGKDLPPGINATLGKEKEEEGGGEGGGGRDWKRMHATRAVGGRVDGTQDEDFAHHHEKHVRKGLLRRRPA
ncbi:basement membrane-specific heparan sulfate proteoglycan core protein-like [Penaeus chinensis]|uniref:basement membrane-specific heparan sulfate proteoglycan core protein-like n=1 Tax=Penaeus chinensis TaxID=139456 RepID=UPI001FB85F1E|nr:basement membrane-specific heparan sulfate proteoglycan core protein-like [Penaeus chinensis]